MTDEARREFELREVGPYDVRTGRQFKEATLVRQVGDHIASGL